MKNKRELVNFSVYIECLYMNMDTYAQFSVVFIFVKNILDFNKSQSWFIYLDFESKLP